MNADDRKKRAYPGKVPCQSPATPCVASRVLSPPRPPRVSLS